MIEESLVRGKEVAGERTGRPADRAARTGKTTRFFISAFFPGTYLLVSRNKIL
jgi:hypothetical protein